MNKSNIVTNNNSSSFALPENKIDSQKILAEIDGEEQYGDGTIDYLLEAQLPKKTVSLTSINLSQKEEDLRSAINDFNENSEAKKLIIPIRTEDGRFTALSLTKESNGTPASATYIDLRGTEQEASPSFLQSGMNWMFGGAKDAAPKTTEIGSLPIHIRNILTTRSKIFPKDITFTTNKIQQPTDNIGEPFLVQILKSLADGKMNVINKSLHEGEQDFGNFSPELSRKADKMSRLEDAKKLVADYPELSSRRLEEKSSEITRGNPQGASTQSIAKFLAAMALITPATSQSTNLRGLGSQSNGDSLSLMDNDFHLEGAPKYPTLRPTSIPNPAFAPTPIPTPSSTTQTPSSKPTATPTTAPTGEPTKKPSTAPTTEPTEGPTTAPSNNPSGEPTLQPSSPPSANPTSKTTNSPSTQTPSLSPTSEPTITATTKSSRPTSEPTIQKTIQPTAGNSSQPTINPSGDPTSKPSSPPSANPTSKTTISPSTQTPSLSPTSKPTITATTKSSSPTSEPTIQKTIQPTAGNSSQPTINPSRGPTSQPSSPPSTATISPSTQVPSSQTNPPTSLPTGEPSQTAAPSMSSTTVPTTQTSSEPSSQPSFQPTKTSNQTSNQPTSQPSNQSSVEPILQSEVNKLSSLAPGSEIGVSVGAGAVAGPITSLTSTMLAEPISALAINTLFGASSASATATMLGGAAFIPAIAGSLGALAGLAVDQETDSSPTKNRRLETSTDNDFSTGIKSEKTWAGNQAATLAIGALASHAAGKFARHAFTAESNISSFLALLLVNDAAFNSLDKNKISKIDKFLKDISESSIGHSADTILLKDVFNKSLKALFSNQGGEIDKISEKFLGKKQGGDTLTLEKLRIAVGEIKNDADLEKSFKEAILARVRGIIPEEEGEPQVASFDNSPAGLSAVDLESPEIPIPIIDQINLKALSVVINEHLSQHERLQEIPLGNIPFIPDYAPEHKLLSLSNEIAGVHDIPSHNPTLRKGYEKRFNQISNLRPKLSSISNPMQGEVSNEEVALPSQLEETSLEINYPAELRLDQGLSERRFDRPWIELIEVDSPHYDQPPSSSFAPLPSPNNEIPVLKGRNRIELHPIL